MTLTNKSLNRKTIFVTGASGYIGSSLVNKLDSLSAKVIRISRKKLPPMDGIDDWAIDLTKYSSWDKVVKSADIIFHLSGNTSIYLAEQDKEESLRSTVLPIIHLINASEKLERKPKVVFASTATVYGLTDNMPVSESATPEPLTTYDLHKFFSEQLLHMANKNNIISSISLRLSNVYGPSYSDNALTDRGFLTNITRTILKGKKINLYNGGRCLRDYVYIDDVVNAFIKASLIDSKDSAVNIVSGKGTSINEAVNIISKEIEKTTGICANIKYVEWPKEINEIEKRNFVGSYKLFSSISGWLPITSLESGIKRLVNHHKN